MVGSNISSGLGRFALCETLESRSLFSVTVGLDAAFAGGEVLTHFGNLNEDAYTGVVLKSGKLLVTGTSYGRNGGAYGAYAVYNKDGSLDKSFSGDGKLVVEHGGGKYDDPRATYLYALSDGSALATGSDWAAKLLPNGQFDKTFGNTGDGRYVFNDQIGQSFVAADGTIRVLTNSSEPLSIITLSAKGKLLGTVTNTKFTGYLTPDFARNGDVLVKSLTFTGHIGLTRLDAKLNVVKTWGFNGEVAFDNAYKAFLTANGPFSFQDGTPVKNGQLPYLLPQDIVADTDGSMVMRCLIYGSSPKVPSFPSEGYGDENGLITPVFVRIDSTGKMVSLTAGENTRSAPFMSPSFATQKPGVSATLHPRSGQAIDVKLAPPPQDVDKGVRQTIPDGNGGYYLVGALYEYSNDTLGGFVVAHLAKPTGSISGVLFNDNNGNGKQDPGEGVNADRQVYIDDNNNGKLDTGEVVTTTNASGKYVFNDLGPGSFRVRRVLPTGYHVSTSSAPVVVGLRQNAVFNIGSNNLPAKKMADLILG